MFQTHTGCGFAHEHSESRYQSAAAWGGECKAEERLQFTGGMAHKIEERRCLGWGVQSCGASAVHRHSSAVWQTGIRRRGLQAPSLLEFGRREVV